MELTKRYLTYNLISGYKKVTTKGLVQEPPKRTAMAEISVFTVGGQPAAVGRYNLPDKPDLSRRP
jgi:hypothetical protein